MFKNGLLVVMIMFVMTSFAQEQKKGKELKTVTYSCNMHCVTCQGKIEHNLAYEKGVKAIIADKDEQTVTVTYRTDKNSEESIKKAIIDLGYKAEIIEKQKATEKKQEGKE